MQDVEGALAIAPCAERVGRVGESVEMNSAGDDGERDDDEDRTNYLREEEGEQPILAYQRDAD